MFLNSLKFIYVESSQILYINNDTIVAKKYVHEIIFQKAIESFISYLGRCDIISSTENLLFINPGDTGFLFLNSGD